MDRDSIIAVGTETKLAASTACKMKTPPNRILRSGNIRISKVGSLELELPFAGDGMHHTRMQTASRPRIAVITKIPDRLKFASRIGPSTKATEKAVPMLIPIAAVIFAR